MIPPERRHGFLPIQEEIRLHVDQSDLARQQPTGLGEGEACKADVLHGLVQCAAQFDKFLDSRRDYVCSCHILARQRLIVHRFRSAVEVPLAGLVEQFQRIFDVGGQANLHAFLFPSVCKMRLEHRDDRVIALPLDALDFAPRMAPDNLITELDVARVLPLGHLDRCCCVPILAVKLSVRQRIAPCPRGALAVDVQLAKVVQVRGGLPASVGIRLPAGDGLPAADRGLLAIGAAVGDRVAAGSRVALIEDKRLGNRIGAAAQNHDDIAGHVAVDRAHRIPGPTNGTERFIQATRVRVITRRGHVERLHYRAASLITKRERGN